MKKIYTAPASQGIDVDSMQIIALSGGSTTDNVVISDEPDDGSGDNRVKFMGDVLWEQ